MNPVIEHVDYLGQPIRVGDCVSFTWAGSRGIRVGTITKLTKQRVKMSFIWCHEYNGVKSYHTATHITRPGDCLILGNGLQQHLTMATLQKRL